MKNRALRFWLRLLPGIAWFFVILVLLLMPGDLMPDEDWLDKIYFDKFAHAGTFGLQSFLFIWAFVEPGITRAKLGFIAKWIIVALSIFGISIEFIQYYFVPGRSFDLVDWGADTLGAFLGWVGIQILFKKVLPAALKR